MRGSRFQPETQEAEYSWTVHPVMILRLDPGKVLKLHFVIIAFLIFCSVGTYASHRVFNIGLIEFLVLDNEANLPTFFAVLMLLEATLLLFLIYISESRRGGALKNYWLVLGLLFAAMAVDEASQIHEKLVDPIRSQFGLTGVFHFSWVLPAFIFVFVLAGYFFRFLISVDRRAARLFILSGSVYLSGALGLEMVGGYFVTSLGVRSVAYVLTANLEEALEMIGVAIFIYALLSVANSRGVYWAIIDTKK